MKTRTALLFLLLLLCAAAPAQRNSLSVGALLGSPLRHSGFGWGLSLEGYRASRPGGAFSLGASVMRLSDGGLRNNDHTSLLALQLGYRQHLHRLYLHPRLGIGAMNGRVDIGGDWARPSVAAFFGTFETGYRPGRFHLGAFVQWARAIEGAKGGTWHTRSYPLAGVRLGYTIAGH